MNNVERIKAELERIMEACHDENGNPITYGEDCAYARLWELKEYIDYMQEVPVSEDLEVAAIDECSKILKGETVLIDGYEYVVLSDAKMCFKAGAKWQKEQMMKDAIDAEVTYGKSLAIPSLGYRLDKEGLDFGHKVKVILIKEG